MSASEAPSAREKVEAGDRIGQRAAVRIEELHEDIVDLGDHVVVDRQPLVGRTEFKPVYPRVVACSDAGETIDMTEGAQNTAFDARMGSGVLGIVSAVPFRGADVKLLSGSRCFGISTGCAFRPACSASRLAWLADNSVTEAVPTKVATYGEITSGGPHGPLGIGRRVGHC